MEVSNERLTNEKQVELSPKMRKTDGRERQLHGGAEGHERNVLDRTYIPRLRSYGLYVAV